MLRVRWVQVYLFRFFCRVANFKFRTEKAGVKRPHPRAKSVCIFHDTAKMQQLHRCENWTFRGVSLILQARHKGHILCILCAGLLGKSPRLCQNTAWTPQAPVPQKMRYKRSATKRKNVAHTATLVWFRLFSLHQVC